MIDQLAWITVAMVESKKKWEQKKGQMNEKQSEND